MGTTRPKILSTLLGQAVFTKEPKTVAQTATVRIKPIKTQSQRPKSRFLRPRERTMATRVQISPGRLPIPLRTIVFMVRSRIRELPICDSAKSSRSRSLP